MSDDDIDAFNNDFVRLWESFQDLTGLTFIFASDHLDFITFFDAKFGLVFASFNFPCHYKTSGAKLMIFMNLRARSSRATGPKMRVPTGSPLLSMSTAELVSKRM